MPEFDLSPAAQHWVNVVLIWVGFGTLAGLLARLLLPTREPAGSISPVVLGIVGSMVGLLVLSLLLRDRPLNPIGPLGLLAAACSAGVLLIGYRLICLLRRDRDTSE